MGESIKELRKICQEPKKEIGSQFCNIWYRPLSIYLTRLFLYTPITANQVTLLSILAGVLGGVFLAFRINLFDLIGAALLQIYWILDHVDGEIARYRKTGSLTGEYIDFAAHYIVYPLFLIGMTVGAYWDVGAIWIFGFGFSAAISIILDKDIYAVIYWVICNEKNNRLKKGVIGNKYNESLLGSIESATEQVSKRSSKNRLREYLRNYLYQHPKIKISLTAFINLVTGGGICSEFGITMTAFLPAIAGLVWGGVNILGHAYSFMTLYLILIGGAYPFLLVARTLKVITASAPDKEYQRFFDQGEMS